MVIRLRDLAVEDRPRERLLREGPLALSDVELLAVVLGTGRGSTEDALGLAHRILERASPLRDRSADELGEIPGVGPVKIARIAAALELGRRNPAKAPAQATPPDADALSTQVGNHVRGLFSAAQTALVCHQLDRPGGTTPLTLGTPLGSKTRAGTVMAQILADGPGRCFVVSVRPPGPPTAGEQAAALRLVQAARLVGVALEGVLIAAGRNVHRYKDGVFQ
ncbi:MAG: hypothetical protein EXR76_13385 [Myxococcales bacterium]|nr:hypothetical protein [Myxococcales bacterium]